MSCNDPCSRELLEALNRVTGELHAMSGVLTNLYRVVGYIYTDMHNERHPVGGKGGRIVVSPLDHRNDDGRVDLKPNAVPVDHWHCPGCGSVRSSGEG